MQRPKRPKNLKIGSLWYYYPKEATRLDELEIGTELVIRGKAYGTKIKQITVSVLMERESIYNNCNERTGSYIYHPEEETFEVFVSDLAKGEK